MKSLLNTTTRLNNASSVHLMNQVLFEFARKFTKFPPRIFEWPMISFDRKSYHPVFGESVLVAKLKDSGVQVMSLGPDYIFDDTISPGSSVVNRKKILNVQGKVALCAKLLGKRMRHNATFLRRISMLKITYISLLNIFNETSNYKLMIAPRVV